MGEKRETLVFDQGFFFNASEYNQKYGGKA
jgi:hypothetical protein